MAKQRLKRRLMIVAAVLVVLIIGGTLVVQRHYNANLSPLSSDQRTQIITIARGSSVKQIADQLTKAKIIRGAWVFEWYVHSKELSSKLQAGTYALSPSQSIPEIVTTMTKGKVETDLVTILPGKRIDQVRAQLINDGFSPAAVDAALQPAQYRDLAVMQYVPASATTLEGMLFPDSFQRTGDTDPAQIVRESLTEMGTHLTPALQAQFASHNLSVYQAITLASIVEKEVDTQSDREQVAQVFLSRLAQGMTLGSDVTAKYGAVMAGQKPSTKYDSPYNTLLYKGLPPSPISTVSASSLQAVATPASTAWLYFLAGDDGTTHFAQTLQQHQQNIDQYCQQNCSQ